MSEPIDYCTKHPEAKSFYHDSKRDEHLCTDCVMAWFDKKEGNHSKERNLGRITYDCPELKLMVGNFESGKDYFGKRIIFNVSDSPSEYNDYWFPINEISAWGYGPFFWFKKLAEKWKDYPKLVHCHAGIHRSLMMGYCWGLSMNYTHSQLAEMFNAPWVTNDYHRDTKNGYIPNDLMKLYGIMDEHPDYSMTGCLRELGTPQLLNNTSLRETTKYQDYLNHKTK